MAGFGIAATASSGLAVSFASATTPVSTVAGSTLTILTPGTCTITASQAGNANYASAVSVSQSFVVASPPNSVTLSVGDGSGNPGQTVELAVQLTAIGTALPAGFQTHLNFDTAKLTFTSARVGVQTTAAGKSLSTNALPGGDVRLLVAGVHQCAIANGVVAYATFTLNQQFTTGSAVVTPKNCVASDGTGTALTTPCSAGTIPVAAGDINVDGATNVVDVQLIINEALRLGCVLP